MDLSRRVHWFCFEHVSAAMVQPPLDPIQRFLFVEPSLRQRVRTKSATTSLQQVDHRESVVTLRPLDAEPVPNPPKERFCLLARSPPCPAVPSATLALGGGNDPTAPHALHPVKHGSIDIRDDNLYSVLVPGASGLEGPHNCDAAFAVHEAGRVSPVGVQRFRQRRTCLGG